MLHPADHPLGYQRSKISRIASHPSLSGSSDVKVDNDFLCVAPETSPISLTWSRPGTAVKEPWSLIHLDYPDMSPFLLPIRVSGFLDAFAYLL
ncbi:hypothetical protein PDE_08898 [Penicillium oxalicum 114-2]|uniref:Uncharacterized protein n=1 Tax=Penicillium oxalicum (strain 114-2 / CGMCC 5302) TaxID=933388 RepID=S7ZYQ8_PENO1|nr:hypothetical protein PDE_08898 [Penicillium oxalicum 114-2]